MGTGYIELLPCAYCDVKIPPDRTHPDNECWLSGYLIRAKDFESWNSRPGERRARSAVLIRIVNFLGQMDYPQEAAETFELFRDYILEIVEVKP